MSTLLPASSRLLYLLPVATWNPGCALCLLAHSEHVIHFITSGHLKLICDLLPALCQRVSVVVCLGCSHKIPQPGGGAYGRQMLIPHPLEAGSPRSGRRHGQVTVRTISRFRMDGRGGRGEGLSGVSFTRTPVPSWGRHPPDLIASRSLHLLLPSPGG